MAKGITEVVGLWNNSITLVAFMGKEAVSLLFRDVGFISIILYFKQKL